MFLPTADAFVSLHRDSLQNNFFFVAAAPRFGAAYHGNVVSFNHDTEVVIDGGHSAIVEVGTTGDFSNDQRNRLGVTGTLLDAPQP